MMAVLVCTAAGAQDFERIPAAWKWVGKNEVAFTYDWSFRDRKSTRLNSSH